MARLSLIVRSAPWLERSGREALDLALSALTMDVPVKLFFVGKGLLQLVAERSSGEAGLAPGQKAWSSLDALGDVTFYAHGTEVDRLSQAGLALTVSVVRLEVGDMPDKQAGSHVLVV